ncbi:MAG: hypothetical protein NC332_04850 [Firmicutes bacterium]|nr:hypothetical protein [Bacillota bacterium]
MAEKVEKQRHYLCCDNGILTIKGVTKALEITEREAQFKLAYDTVIIKGVALNVTRLDKEQGVVVMEYASLTSVAFRQNGMSIKGLFR